MPAADAWSLDAQRRSLGSRPTSPDESEVARWEYGWALQTLALATILGYVLAAWAKARNGGLDWITGDVLRNHIAYDNLQKRFLGDPSSPLARFTVPYRWLFPPMAAASMVIEGRRAPGARTRPVQEDLGSRHLVVPRRDPRAHGDLVPIPTARRGLPTFHQRREVRQAFLASIPPSTRNTAPLM